MRLFHIAHGLISRTGHHYMEARALKEAAAKQGLDCTILAHCDIGPAIRDELSAVPLFRHTPYKKFSRYRWLRGPKGLFRFGYAMRRQLLSLPPATITAADLLVCPLTKAREIFGLALWLAKIPREQHPFLALNFMIDDISRPSAGSALWTLDRQTARLYRFAFSRLRKATSPDRLLLSAGGPAFAQAMTQILRHPVEVLPLPVQHELPSAPSSGAAPLIVYPGHMQKRKGSDLAAGVIRKVLKRRPDCRFLLQANPDRWENRWTDEIGPVGMKQVIIHKGEMSQEEYQAAMGRADIVLLPYLPAGYALQTSGVFSEAMALGKVCIIPEGTWMADMAWRHGGGAATFPSHDAEAIAAACLQALENLPQLREKALQVSSSWRDGMGMKAYLQRILQAACR